MGFYVPRSLGNTVKARIAATETEGENSKEPSILTVQNLLLGGCQSWDGGDATLGVT